MATGIITALSNLFSGRNFSKITDTQERALVDALAFAMAADHDVSDVERTELVKALRLLDWNESTPLESYVEQAIERAQEMASRRESMLEYCLDISERLADDWVREETYYLAARITTSDHRVNEDERSYLQAMVQAFNIDDAAQARITDQVMRETQF